MSAALLVACVRVPKNWGSLDYSAAIAAIEFSDIPEEWTDDSILDEIWYSQVLPERGIKEDSNVDQSMGALADGDEYEQACRDCAQRHIMNVVLPHLIEQAKDHELFPALCVQPDLPFDLLVTGGASWGESPPFADQILHLGALGIWDYHIPKFTAATQLCRTTGRVEYAVLNPDGSWHTEVYDVPNDITTADGLDRWPHDNLKIAGSNDVAGFAVMDSDSNTKSEE